MSDLREEILGSGINKKRVIGTALIALILIGIFAFSTVFFSFLFGSQRPTPSLEKDITPDEDALLIKPPFPFDEDFWQDLLDDFNMSLLDDLNIDNETLADLLSDLLDGDLSDLDLGNFSMSELLPLLALLGLAGAGDIEIFRVYNYDSLVDMTDVLWKFECFDEYTGDGWHSTASLGIYSFYDYGDYYSNYAPDPELLKIKMPVPSPEIGKNTMTIPTLFPNPYVMDGSVLAPNLDSGLTVLHKNDYNCTTIDLYFNSNEGVNMTYEMFGLNLPTDQQINNSAIEATYTPTYIKTKYLQLPPTIALYKANNPYFNSHFNTLNTLIDANDNAFEVANKIKDYLNTYFNLPRTMEEFYDYEPAPEGTDVVEWFCQNQIGLFSDFASAFCAFSRAFGVASRFVDGFNSLQIEEFFDNDEGQNTFAIKYENLYSWAEIFVPTDVSGKGKWVQFDIAPLNVLGGNYSIQVETDSTIYSRPDVVNINATLSSGSDPVYNQLLTFTDLTTGEVIGQNYTNSYGVSSIQYNIDNSHVVGSHVIEAKYDDVIFDRTKIGLLGGIVVTLTYINPNIINLSDSQPDTVNVQGYVYDPLNGERVRSAAVGIILLQKGTNNEIFGAFDPPGVVTDSNGEFDEFLDLTTSITGQYDVRVDFNGTWIINLPSEPFWTIPSIANSSNRLELNITKDLTPWFYIEGIPTYLPNFPRVSRYQNLNLSVIVMSTNFGPVSNKLVSFYDYSRGGKFIGSDISDANGLASINYNVGDYCVAGPNLLYARIGLQENYSYFILDEEPTINIISGPSPPVINRTGAGTTQFNIVGEIYDSTNNSLPIKYSEITLKLLKSGLDYSFYLVPSESYPYQTDSTGTFDLTFGVSSTTPPGNYTLRLDFNGTIDLLSYPYPFPFNLPYLNTSVVFSNDLQINIPLELQFSFWINGTLSNNYNNPRINRNDHLNLTAYIHIGGVPIDDGELVEFYDITQDNLFIGFDTTNSGYATFIYQTDGDTIAGPHLIYAVWNSRYNYSYFIMDAPISINLDIWPQNREINKYGPPDDTFIIQGYLNDTNTKPIKYGQISIHIFKVGEIYNGLILESGSYQTDQYGAIYAEFSIDPVLITTGNYTLEVWFNGTFLYSSPNNIYNEHNFYLPYINASATANYQLRVYDPNDIKIQFLIDGNPTRTFYSDSNPPERYNRGAIINFSVYITQAGTPVTSDTLTIYDVYNNNQPIDFYIYDGSETPIGQYDFLIDTSSWHGGLYLIKVNWSSFPTFNTTYVIINETVNIFSSINIGAIIRDVDNFIVSGTVRESGVLLRGLQLNIILLDDTYSDVSMLYLSGTQTITINNDGTYQFLNSVDLLCPQGEYYINVTFTGGISAPGISLSNFMIHNNSILIPIDVLADTYIIGNYETNIVKDDWYYGDDCYVYGYLYWDNDTVIAGMEINVTIRDGTGSIITWQIGTTDGTGFFNLTFIVGDWQDNTEIWVNFYPDDPDNFGILDGLYIISTEQELDRQP